MKRFILKLTVCLAVTILASCHQDKPKPSSDNITKQAVTVNGKKDSVINNAKRNYGNATVSEPCVKCLIQAVQATADYKASVTGLPANAITYNINWVRGEDTPDSNNTKGATNALKIVLINKAQTVSNLPYFMYDNSVAKLFLIKNNDAKNKKEIKTDDVLLKKIRNACYWGVASGN